MTRLLMAFILTYSVSACSAGGFANLVYNDPPKKHFDTTKVTAFASFEQSIEPLIFKRTKNNQINRFCIIGYEWDAPTKYQAPIYWYETNEVIWWNGATDDEDTDSIWLNSKVTQLEQDTVLTKDEIKGSTYLLVKSEVDAVINDCKKNGINYTIQPIIKSATEQN